ncbi:MAG: MFS transporter, partial [Bacteroidales bacterium]
MKYNRRYTVLTALIVALGGFLLGFDSAVISGAVPFIKNYFVLNDIQLGWSVSCLILGAMLGNALAGPVSDRIGRKSTLIITSVLFTISAVSSALA